MRATDPGWCSPTSVPARRSSRCRNHPESLPRLAAELRSRRTNELLVWWRAWLTPTLPDAVATVGHAAVSTSDHVGARIRKAHRRLIAGGRAIDAASPTEDVHDLRKDAKRLRYLLECFGGLYDAKPRRAFVARSRRCRTTSARTRTPMCTGATYAN